MLGYFCKQWKRSYQFQCVRCCQEEEEEETSDTHVQCIHNTTKDNTAIHVHSPQHIHNNTLTTIHSQKQHEQHKQHIKRSLTWPWLWHSFFVRVTVFVLVLWIKIWKAFTDCLPFRQHLDHPFRRQHFQRLVFQGFITPFNVLRRIEFDNCTDQYFGFQLVHRIHGNYLRQWNFIIFTVAIVKDQRRKIT